MIATTNFELIHELFDNVLILDSENRIVFEGRLLKPILKSSHIAINNLFSKKPSDNADVNLLKETVKKVRSTLEPHSLKFENVNEEFILLPLNLDFHGYILFALKSKTLQITKIEHDLKERIKELRCLYNVSKELEIQRPISESIAACIKHVKEAFQFPEETVVNFEVQNKVYGEIDWDPKTINSISSAEIIVDKKKYGEIKIFFKGDVEIPEEEQKMIEETAGKFAKAIEESWETTNLEKQKKILLAKNEALLRLTEECHKQREKLHTFFNAITDKIVVIDHDFEIMMSNKNDIGESGKCYNKLFNLEYRCASCPAAKTFETAENIILEREAGEKYFTLSSYPIFNQEGKVDRVLEVCHDITVRKKMEAQLLQSYKLASLGKLVAGVAHEINNPNTFILGNLKIIQEALTDIFPILDDNYSRNKELKIARLNYDTFKENISTLISDMINGANRTKKIVGDLRNFAKKDDGSLTDTVDLNDIIKNNMTLTRKHIKKFAELECELGENIPVFKGNINKLEQVLLNLVMNASEAIENGEGLITVKTDYDENNKEVLLIVKDTGCGMDENTLKNIFDPFFTTKRDKGGTGLGLSITYGIIKDHNGIIEVESKVGVGTTFKIRFPIKSGVENYGKDSIN